MQSTVRRATATAVGAAARRRHSRPADSPLRRLLEDASSFGEMAPREPALRWATEPYAAAALPALPALPAPSTDPRDTSVLLFPGQGSHYVGMGRALRDVPAARDLYELASSVLGWDVWRTCTEGPAEVLAARGQTCVVVTSLGALEAAREARPAALARVRAAAGFSLGEITALVYAGALPPDAALRLVEVRAAAMRAAARQRRGGMLTVWLAPDARLAALLREAAAAAGAGAVCRVANYLYPGCKVIAGDERALEWVERRGAALGVRRAQRVPVEGAFHTPLMGGAADAVRAALAALPAHSVRAPRLPVVSCVDARALRDAAHVRRQLARLVTQPVRWEQTLHALYARPPGHGFPLTLALGPGRALRATLRQVNAKAWDSCVQIDV